MSNITYEQVSIEITYSNSETKKHDVHIGDRFIAEHELVNGKPTMKCWFSINDTTCIAYACEHDEDAEILVTTCKIITE